MYIKFWGTRGSLPTALTCDDVERKIRRALEGAVGLDLSDSDVIDHYIERLPIITKGTMGGETTCMELQSGEQTIVIDMGSGIRKLGLDMLFNRSYGKGHKQIDILVTHTHWDHVQGFPFFIPAYIPHNILNFHSPIEDLESRINQQQEPRFFPVSTKYMNSTFNFITIKPNSWHQIGNIRVYPFRLSHPGFTYGYRIEDGNSVFVCATDSEYKRVDPESTKRYVELFNEADMLIFDAQYTWSEALDKIDWGHSSAIMGSEMAYRAKAKRLVLFHHDPTSTDEKIWAAKALAEAYLENRISDDFECEVFIGYDGFGINF